MSASLYSFVRRIQDNSGQQVGQVVSVFAGNLDEATRLVEDELAHVREELRTLPSESRRREPSFEETPEWTVDKTVLDRPKIVSFFVT